jgi:uncharacterized protein YneF (UPF0154 family)
MKNITLWVVTGVVAFIAIFIIGMWISTSNQEIGLRNQATAQQEANKAIFDKVWKVIQQKAQVADQSADKFKEIYTSIMKERYEGDQKQAPLFKWIQEQNPTFDISIYKEISDAVESNRAEFLTGQKRLIDIKRVHDDLRLKFPGSIVVGSRPALDIQIVTSEKTQAAFDTKREDDVNLFKK